MNDDLVYSSKLGDLRKDQSKISKDNCEVDESSLQLLLRHLTSSKGRTVIEIKGLPANKEWCKGLAKELKKKLVSVALTKMISLKFTVKIMSKLKILRIEKNFFQKIGGKW